MTLLTRRAALGMGLAALAAPLRARGPASYPPPDREQMVATPAGRLYVRVNGNLRGHRPPLVMIHGGPGGSHAAFLDALALSDERAVILYDQLDSGRSDHPGDPANWTVPRFVDEVAAVRAALGIRRWHVLGHSWGGTIALEYGARRPRGLASLILASPLVSTRSWLADAAILRGALPAATRATLARCETPAAPPAGACDAATDLFYKAYNRREAPADGLIAYRAGFDSFNRRLYETMWGKSEFVSTGTLAAYDGEPLLARLDGRRTLFMAGQYDEARPATVLGFAARVPGSQFAGIAGAAHGIFSDRPEESRVALRRWMWRWDRG